MRGPRVAPGGHQGSGPRLSVCVPSPDPPRHVRDYYTHVIVPTPPVYEIVSNRCTPGGSSAPFTERSCDWVDDKLSPVLLSGKPWGPSCVEMWDSGGHGGSYGGGAWAEEVR